MAHSKERRRLVVESYKAGKGTYVEIADMFAVGEASVSRWLRKERETGQLEPEHSGGMPPKIDVADHELVMEILAEQSDITLAELAEEYSRRTGKKVSSSPIKRILKKLDITRKKKTIRASEQNSEAVRQKRDEFLKLMSELLKEDLVFLDEMGTNLNMTRRYARSPLGERAYDTLPGGYSKNVSVVGALTLDGVLTLMTLSGAFNGPAFVAFVEQLLVPALRPGQIVVMDNVRFHKVAGVSEAIEAVGCAVYYQPAYSPDLNPIEECWSKMKAFLRKLKARTRAALDDAIALAANVVTPEDAAGWFQHCLEGH